MRQTTDFLIPNRRDAGQTGCMTKRDAGKEGRRTGGIQDWMDAGKKRFR